MHISMVNSSGSFDVSHNDPVDLGSYELTFTCIDSAGNEGHACGSRVDCRGYALTLHRLGRSGRETGPPLEVWVLLTFSGFSRPRTGQP